MATCIVSGNLVDGSGAAVSGATVSAEVISPYIYGGSLIAGKLVSTTTDSSGDWSLTLNETETISRSIVIQFEYADGAGGLKRAVYAVVVPNDATAEFSDLVSPP